MAARKTTTGEVTSIFKAEATLDELKALRGAYDAWIAAGEGLALDGFPMRKFTEASGLKYSRARQITRRWYIEEQAPNLLIGVRDMVLAATAKRGARMLEQGESDEGEALGGLLRDLHTKGHSWGDLSGRTGLTESRCRALFEYKSTAKAKGQRVGQGGAFAYGNPTLYLDNMKAEGAWIPASHRGSVKAEDCLNYKPTPKVRAKRASKATKAA